MRSPGESVAHGALDVLGAEVELGEQRARLGGLEAAACGEDGEQRLGAVVGDAPLVERAEHGRPADDAAPGRER